MPFGPWPGAAPAGGGFPGFGGAPPAIASASAGGAAGTASRSDHTHALDFVAYNPSVVGMQASGVLQQSYAAPTATPSVLTMTQGNLPFGAAGGVLTQDAGLTYSAGNGTLTIAGLQNGTPSAIVLNSTLGAGTSSSAIEWQRSGTRLARLRFLFNTTPQMVMSFDAVAGQNPHFDVTGTIATFIAYTLTGDVGVGNFSALATNATGGFLWMPQAPGAFTGVATNPNGVSARVATGIDSTNLRHYVFVGGAWHFAQFADFAPTFNSVTAQAATGLSLSGNGASQFFTSTSSLDFRANTGGVLGVTSTEIVLNAGTDISVVGNLIGSMAVGSAAAPWASVNATALNAIAGGAVGAALNVATGLAFSAAGTQSVTKANGALFLQTTTANDLVFRTNSTEALRVDNATTLLKFAAPSTVANGAVATVLTGVGPAGASATVQEWFTFINSAGVQRWVPCF